MSNLRFYEHPESALTPHNRTVDDFLWRRGDVLLDSEPYIPELPLVYILCAEYHPYFGRVYSVCNVRRCTWGGRERLEGVGMVYGNCSAEMYESERYSFYRRGNGEAAG